MFESMNLGCVNIGHFLGFWWYFGYFWILGVFWFFFEYGIRTQNDPNWAL